MSKAMRITECKNGFAVDADFSPNALLDDINSGAYNTDDFQSFELRKHDGGTRTIIALRTIDTVAHRAVALCLNEMVDAKMSDCSFAYRHDMSATKAATSIRRHITDGYGWMVTGDVSSYFDNINHRVLMDAIGDMACPEMADIVRSCIEPITQCGIPQGSPLSPLLSNIYLDSFDKRMSAIAPFARYSDNFAILADTREAATSLSEQAVEMLRHLRLSINGYMAPMRALGSTFVGETI